MGKYALERDYLTQVFLAMTTAGNAQLAGAVTTQQFTKQEAGGLRNSTRYLDHKYCINRWLL